MNYTKEINNLSVQLDEIWTPKWFSNFSDHKNGGFHERLNQDFTPINLPKRLLSQCRQIIVYAQYLRYNHITSGVIWDMLHSTFDYVTTNYQNIENGGFVFSINNIQDIKDQKRDLYAHAFVILMYAEFYKTTGNKKALTLSKQTLTFIDQKFRTKTGFHEALDAELKPIPMQRRQNPHMHLFEACTVMYDACNDENYIKMATELFNLFFDHFFDAQTGNLYEFFQQDLTICEKDGNKIEAGHHAEWIWLLDNYQKALGKKSTQIEEIKAQLFHWVLNHGTDDTYGGVYNVQAPSGKTIDSNKRIWCQFETLRGCIVMMRNEQYKSQAHDLAERLLSTITNHYIDLKTGGWSEILDPNLNPLSNYLPATTPYHIYPVIKDCQKDLINSHYNFYCPRNISEIKKIKAYDVAFMNSDHDALAQFEREALNGAEQYDVGTKVSSPWGENMVLEANIGPPEADIDIIKKEITVKPGFMLSLQLHRGRTEKWIIQSGVLTVISDGKRLELKAGEEITLPKGNVHCMNNVHDEPVTVIEIQHGFCREADNVRLIDFNNRPTIPLTSLTEAKSAMLYAQLHDEICNKFGCKTKPTPALLTNDYVKIVSKD